MTDTEDAQLRAIAARVQALTDKVTEMSGMLTKMLLETQLQAVRADRDAAIASLGKLYEDARPSQVRGYNRQVEEIAQKAANKIKQLQTLGPQ